MLKHHCNVRSRTGYGGAIDQNCAGVADDQTVDDTQQRSLSAPARTQDAEAFIILDVEIDFVQRENLPAAVGFDEVLNPDARHWFAMTVVLAENSSRVAGIERPSRRRRLDDPPRWTSSSCAGRRFPRGMEPPARQPARPRELPPGAD